MVIPYDALNPESLNGLIEEFITRDGAVHGHREVTLESQVNSVLSQLKSGKVVILYDEEEETCNIVQASTTQP